MATRRGYALMRLRSSSMTASEKRRRSLPARGGASGHQRNDSESAIVTTLPANDAAYTAIVRGVDGTTSIAVVEVYALD